MPSRDVIVFPRLFPPPYIQTPSLFCHGFSFTKDINDLAVDGMLNINNQPTNQLSLYFMYNFTIFYVSTSLTVNIKFFSNPKGGGQSRE